MAENNEKLDFEYEDDGFTMVSNEIIINSNISSDARLLYAIIKHYITIPNFVLYKNTLKKALGCSSDNTFDKYWSELKKIGLLIQNRVHSNGRWVYKYKLTSKAIQDPKNWGIPKKQGVKKQGLEKQGDSNLDEYSKTDSNNTYLSKNEENNVVASESQNPRDSYQLIQKCDEAIDKYSFNYETEREIFITDHIEELKFEFIEFVKEHLKKSEVNKFIELNSEDVFELFDKFKGIKNLNGFETKYSLIKNPDGFMISELRKKVKTKEETSIC